MLDVCIATLGKRKPTGLRYLGTEGVDYRILTDSSAPWGAAANALLDASENDVLFMDDDIELLPKTVPPKCALNWLAPDADVIGFMLRDPFNTGKLPQGPYICSAQGGQVHPLPAAVGGAMLKPVYCAHVTASLLYVKRSAIDGGLRFPVWPGSHYEDVAFTMDAWVKGFKVAFVPLLAHHHMSNAAGATKGVDPDFEARRAQNLGLFQQWCIDNGIAEKIGTVIPSQALPIGDDGMVEWA